LVHSKIPKLVVLSILQNVMKDKHTFYSKNAYFKAKKEHFIAKKEHFIAKKEHFIAKNGHINAKIACIY
jgi:hypothetical protein